MHLRFEMLLLSYGKKWNTKELECLQEKLLDVSFDKVIKFGVLYLEEEKEKRCKRRVLFVRQVDVFHFHGLPCFLLRVCKS